MTSLRLTLTPTCSSPKLLAPPSCVLAAGSSSRRPRPLFPTCRSVFEGRHRLHWLATASQRASRSSTVRCFAFVLTPELKNTSDEEVTSHKVVLSLKGTKDLLVWIF